MMWIDDLGRSAIARRRRRCTWTVRNALLPKSLPLKWAADIRAGSGPGTRKETFTGAPIDMGRTKRNVVGVHANGFEHDPGLIARVFHSPQLLRIPSAIRGVLPHLHS